MGRSLPLFLPALTPIYCDCWHIRCRTHWSSLKPEFTFATIQSFCAAPIGYTGCADFLRADEARADFICGIDLPCAVRDWQRD